jgi:2-amino-4-hydroxy-6-hydroxymethyldihydropteridine diphosphokinase
MATAYIALGSNLGHRAAHLQQAVEDMGALPDTRVVAESKVYETAPAPGSAPGQGLYLNAVVQLDTSLEPHALLDALRDIEEQHGRQRREKWGPRTLDLDILLYDDQVIDTDALTIPHPHMHERPFVLEPLCDIAPDAVHPQQHRTAQELLRDLKRTG